MFYLDNIKVHPGELFTLPLVIVGADFGTTGTVHAVLESTGAMLKTTSQYVQGVRNKFNYTILSRKRYEIMYLTTMKELLTTVETNIRSINNTGSDDLEIA